MVLRIFALQMKWWDKLSNIGLDNNETIEHVRYVHILNRIFFLACFFTALYIPVLILLHDYVYCVVQLVCFIFTGAAYWFNYKKQFRFASYYVFFFLILNLTSAILVHNDIGGEYLMIPGSLAAFVIFKRKSDSLIILVFFILACAAAQILKHYIPPVLILEENLRTGFYYLNIFISFMVSGSIITNFKSVIESYEETVLTQKKQIEERSKEITDSINYAKRIQYTLLAHGEFLKNNLPEHFILFKPKDIVSGDFYWATRTSPRGGGREGAFYLAVCDSTGHGVPGAFMSLLNISFLNEAISEKNIVNPNEVFNYVRKRLITTISQEGGQDGMDGILCCIDNGKITYAGANNAPVLVRNDQLIEQPADKMPIGKGESTSDFNLYSIEVNKGDLLYLFTDGFADQFGGPKGKKYKYKQLEEKLKSISNLPLSEQKSILERSFNDWKGELEQVDDVLVIGIRI